MRARSLGGSAARRRLFLGFSGCIVKNPGCTHADIETPSLSRFAVVMCATGPSTHSVSSRCHAVPGDITTLDSGGRNAGRSNARYKVLSSAVQTLKL